MIDGVIEDAWLTADSAFDFIQFYPCDGEKPTDQTVVYVLQDGNNIYFAFRCYAVNEKPFVNLGGGEDNINIFLDPFASKTTAYIFCVTASGSFSDGMMLDDGRTEDYSWDGVWYYAVKVFEREYDVEVKIPFKTIRYDKNIAQWGVDFSRYIKRKQESSLWTAASPVEGHLVSKYGILANIVPGAGGYNFELYPEVFVNARNEPDTTGSYIQEYRGSYSLNFKWDITPQVSTNATYHPDFAQIESDPFTLNLSQYETYLEERRPFFLEGKEVFRMADFGEGKGFFRRLDLFYSRRVGKVIGDEPVPIDGGVKITAKARTVEAGVLGVRTSPVSEEVSGGADSTIEPARIFGVFRARCRFLEASEVGLLFSSMMVDADTHNYALGIDGTYRMGVNQVVMQAAVSDFNNRKGWAITSGYFGFIGSLLSMGSILFVDDSFDVSTIGYVPWQGIKRCMFFTGPFKQFRSGFLRNYWLGIGPILNQAPGEHEHWSVFCNVIMNPNFSNNYGFDLEPCFGFAHEADTAFFSHSTNLSVWGDGITYDTWFGAYYEYGWNYSRDFLAYNASVYAGYVYTRIPRTGLELDLSSWIEWDTSGTVLGITPMLTPRVSYMFVPAMKFSLFNELVFSIPGTAFCEATFMTNRLGFLFSWNFRPKSWLYIAINDHRADESGDRSLQNQIGAIKIKYLLYF